MTTLEVFVHVVANLFVICSLARGIDFAVGIVCLLASGRYGHKFWRKKLSQNTID
jgi:hypothetical protein